MLAESAVKAIIFDCFGVLVQEGWRPFCNEHFGQYGEKRKWADEQMQMLSKGLITTADFVKTISTETGLDEETFLVILHSNPANDELFEYIKNTLKSHFKIGLLSNTGSDRLHELFSQDQIELFDSLVLSYETGYAKPELKIYELSAKTLGVETEECVFVDDILRFCDGAESAGMRAVQYNDFSQFKKEIEKLL